MVQNETTDLKVPFQGMDHETAQRYLSVRVKIEECVDQVYAIGSLLGALSELDGHRSSIDPRAIATLGKMISQDVCMIIDVLENQFVYTLDLKSALKEEMSKTI